MKNSLHSTKLANIDYGFIKIVRKLLSMIVFCSSLRPKYNLMTTDAWKRRKFSSSSPAASKASIASSFSSSSQKELAVVSYCVLLFSCCVCRILALALDVRIESYIVCLSSWYWHATWWTFTKSNWNLFRKSLPSFWLSGSIPEPWCSHQ